MPDVLTTTVPRAGPAAIGSTVDPAATDETDDATLLSVMKAILREMVALNAALASP